jgi:hypothetical protein
MYRPVQKNTPKSGSAPVEANGSIFIFSKWALFNELTILHMIA